jgi:hypothetical protein
MSSTSSSTNPVAAAIDPLIPDPAAIAGHEAMAEHHSTKQAALYAGDRRDVDCSRASGRSVARSGR